MAPRATTLTKLVWGGVSAPVGLWKTTGDPEGLPTFDTAGPNGGVLLFETKAEAAPEQEPAPDDTDPLSAVSDAISAGAAGSKLMEPMDGPLVEATRGDPGPDRSPSIEETAETLGSEGQFRQVLREQGTGVWVEKEEIRRGVRLADGEFVDLTEQLAMIEERTKLDRIEIEGFVDVAQVRRSRVKGAYYLGSGGKGAPKVLRLLYEAMRHERRAAVVKLTKRTRQTLGVVTFDGRLGVLIVLELAWSSTVREPNEKVLALKAAEVSPAELASARALVCAMSDSILSLDDLEDDALVLRRELREDALAGKVTAVIAPAPTEPEPDLLEALERSVANVGG